MSDPARTPRTWLPLALAGGIGAVVIIGAFAFTAFSQRLSAAESAAAQACEAAFRESGNAAQITAGDIYPSADWRDLESFLEEQGLAPEGEVDADAMDAGAGTLAAEGIDLVEVVWWLDDESHLACTVEVQDSRAIAETVVLGPPTRLALTD